MVTLLPTKLKCLRVGVRHQYLIKDADDPKVMPKCKLVWEPWTFADLSLSLKVLLYKIGRRQKLPHRIGMSIKGDNTHKASNPLC